MMPRHSPLARAGLAGFVLLVIYASLYPFSGWTHTGVSPWAYLSAPLPRYRTLFDTLTNLWGYMPLGMLVVLSLYPRVTAAAAVVAAAFAGLALSGTLEATQTYLPARIPSNLDLVANTLGALLGGLVIAPFCAQLMERGSLRRLRRRWFEPHATFAILLLALWPFAQIFPQEFLFGMGGMARDILLDPSPDTLVTGAIHRLHRLLPWLPDGYGHAPETPQTLQHQERLEALISGCSWIGAGLLATVAMRQEAPMRRLLALWLGSALLVKAAATWLQFPAGSTWNWLSSGGRLGLIVGSSILLLMVRAPRWLRGAMAMAMLLTLIVLSNLLPPSPYAWVSAQAWRLGRFVHFNSLSQWIGWIWPFLGMAYLIWRAEHLPRRRAPPPCMTAGGNA